MRRSFYLLVMGVLCSFTCLGDELATGEWAWMNNGNPSMIGQTTQDHLFARNSYNDLGTMKAYDNVVSFRSGAVQTVWVWLDDDEIYLNDRVQALTPIAYNRTGDLYNEITYNSLGVEVYLPMSMQLIEVEDENGDERFYQQGDRLPSTTDVTVKEKTRTRIVDGKEYRVFSVVISNVNEFGSHFSAKNASMYRSRGALRKDDAPLLALYVKNNNQSQAQARLDQDMIIANLEFGFREGIRDGWDPNDYRFIYGTGGNNQSQRFQLYNRIALYGSEGITSDGQVIPGDADGDGLLTISDVTILIDVLLGGNYEGFNEQNADCDHDGSLTISDVTALIDALLSGAPLAV